MRASYFFLLTLLAVSAGAIINGEPCAEEQFPASLAVIELDNSGYVKICGATLIAPDVAVTAAHCIEYFFKPSYSLTKTQYYVTSKTDAHSLNDSDLGPHAQNTIRVHAIVIHTGYQGFQRLAPYDDIALLFLSRRSNLPPAKMLTPQQAEQSLQTGLTAYIVGWGQQQIGFTNTKPTKHFAESFVNQLSSWEMQLGSLSYTAHKCFGDSGGATYIQFAPTAIGAAPPLLFAGISSHGSGGDKICEKGGFDTRVDVYYDWILEAMRAECQTGRRLFCS